MKWTPDGMGGCELWDEQGQLVGWVVRDLRWYVAGGVACGRSASLAEAQAAVEAAVWTRAAEGLGR